MDCLEVVMVLIWPLAGGWEAVRSTWFHVPLFRAYQNLFRGRYGLMTFFKKE